MKPLGFFLMALLLGSVAMLGCAAEAYYEVPAPPPPVIGAIGVAPGPGYLWIDGFFDLRGRTWVWVAGYWVMPHSFFGRRP